MLLKKQIYTASETAELLNVFVTTVLHLISTGKLKAYRSSDNEFRIPKVELSKFIKDYNLLIVPKPDIKNPSENDYCRSINTKEKNPY